jgi:hypothetical protein
MLVISMGLSLKSGCAVPSLDSIGDKADDGVYAQVADDVLP